MSYERFEVPDVDELKDHEGIDVRSVAGGVGVFRIGASSTAGEVVELVVDPLGRSVRLVVSTDGRPTIDLYREAATKFEIREVSGTLTLAVRFRVEELTGELEVTIGRDVRVRDVLLFC